MLDLHVGENAALLVVDPQNDFCSAGALAVPGAEAIFPAVNRLSKLLPVVVASQDWHPPDHLSFSSQHPGHQPFDKIELDGQPQTLWPDHCLAGSPGAAFHPHFDQQAVMAVVRKGYRRSVDSYSAFFDNQQRYPSGLHGYLHDLGVQELVVCGLAFDYCVWYSAVDACQLGYQTSIFLPACAAISATAEADLAPQAAQLGVKLLGSLARAA